VFLGLYLNVSACLRVRFTKTTEHQKNLVTNRTQVYGYLIRYFRDQNVDSRWIRVSKILPETTVWDEWVAQILAGKEGDPKDIYDEIDANYKNR